MDSHSGADDENVFISKALQRLSEAVVLIQVLAVKQRDLHYRHAQWVLLWIKSCETLAKKTYH